MSVRAFINISHMLYQYGQTSYWKETIRDNVGRFKLYKQTNFFLNKNEIRNLKSLSQKEKNILANVLANNPFKNDILKSYNFRIKNGDALEDNAKLFKSIASFSELLKAEPYCEPEFSKAMLSFIVNAYFDKQEGSLSILRKSLNSLQDKSLIKDYMSGDVIKVYNALTIFKQNEKIKELEEVKSIKKIAINGMITTYATYHLDSSFKIIDKAVDFLGDMNSSTTSIIIAVGVFSVGFISLYKLVNNVVDKIIDSHSQLLVNTMEPEKFNKNALASVLGNKLLSRYTLSQNKENNKELAIYSFLVEKINNKELKLSDEIINEFNITSNEANKINKLTQNDIHLIANIRTNEIRDLFLMENISYEDKVLLIKIDLINALDKDAINKNKYESFDSIKGISKNLKQKINSMQIIEQKIILNYLNINREENGNPSRRCLKLLEENVSFNNDFKEILSKSLNNDFNNKVTYIEKNKLSFYVFKEVWSWISDNSKKLTRVNKDIVLEIDRITESHNLQSAEKVNDYYLPLANKTLKQIKSIRNNIVNNKEKIELKLK